jgi:hypothetical protein
MKQLITKVTITGADDRSDIQELIDISSQYPFVEWAILVSKSSEGHYRFPSRQWVELFARSADEHKLNVSAHVCGQWVRQLLIGKLHWYELPAFLDVAQRVQINTHNLIHESTAILPDNLAALSITKQYIFQLDGVNDHLPFAMQRYGLNIAGLFDSSGGTGQVPRYWPTVIEGLLCGYAGGLGPDNLLSQLREIDKAASGQPYWIDMERNVRSEDDAYLLTEKVRKVLDLASPFVISTQPEVAHAV